MRDDSSHWLVVFQKIFAKVCFRNISADEAHGMIANF